MSELLVLGIEGLAALFAVLGLTQVSNQLSGGFVNWLSEKLNSIPLFGPLSVFDVKRLDTWIAHHMASAFNYTATRGTKWFAHVGQAYKYNRDNAYRQTAALFNTLAYITGKWGPEQALRATAETKALVSHLAGTKAPTPPQRRITQHDADIAFQKLIDANFGKKLTEKFPKWEWDPSKWRKWLGVLPGLAPALTPHGQPGVVPKPIPQPRPAPGQDPATRPSPGQDPHTDDSPNPDPGTHQVPSVAPGVDKWSRRQIHFLQKRHVSLLHRLGPLAFMALPVGGALLLQTLIRCKNFKRGLPKFCAAPSHLIDDFLALLTDFFILSNICTILPWLEQGFNLIEPAIAEVTAGAAAIACSDGYDKPIALRVPALHLPPSPSRLPVLQLP